MHSRSIRSTTVYFPKLIACADFDSFLDTDNPISERVTGSIKIFLGFLEDISGNQLEPSVVISTNAKDTTQTKQFAELKLRLKFKIKSRTFTELTENYLLS